MADRNEHVLIAGVSTRALAWSAVRAGYRVSAVDAFGDLDLRAVADVVALTRESGGFAPDAAAAEAGRISADAVAYTSNFENYPDAVTRLASGRRLLGNPAEVLRAVRDPLRVMRALRSRGVPVPLTRSSAPATPVRPGTWLLKPRRSGGGHGTRPWPGGAVPRRAYLQERIRGVPGSVIFLADGRRVHPLGITRQLVGERAFGAAGFRYCGSLARPGRCVALRRRGPVAPGRAGTRPRRHRGVRTRRAQRDRFHRPGRRGLADRGEPAGVRLDGAGGAHGRALRSSSCTRAPAAATCQGVPSGRRDPVA